MTVGYKWLLGPFGLGYLYGSPARQEGRPLQENWILRADAEDFARLIDYRSNCAPGARRFDVGQRTAFELTPMAVTALEQLSQWTVPRIAGLRVFVERAVDAFAEGYALVQQHAARLQEAERREFIDDLLYGGGDLGRPAERAERLGLRLPQAHTVAVAQGRSRTVTATRWQPAHPAGH